MRKFAVFCLLPLAARLAVAASDDNPNIDPLALRVLQATLDSIKNAQKFSFHALVAREQMGTNGQIVTMFNTRT
jgi:hypothetical protein